MIPEFIARFDAARPRLLDRFKAAHPDCYEDIVRAVVEVLHDEDEYATPDPSRIVEINHGDYQGTLVYVIGATGYQPSAYWAVKVGYGSCSVCDTLEAIKSEGKYGAPPTDDQAQQYFTLALHVVQGLKELCPDD